MLSFLVLLQGQPLPVIEGIFTVSGSLQRKLFRLIELQAQTFYICTVYTRIYTKDVQHFQSAHKKKFWREKTKLIGILNNYCTVKTGLKFQWTIFVFTRIRIFKIYECMLSFLVLLQGQPLPIIEDIFTVKSSLQRKLFRLIELQAQALYMFDL